MIYLQQDDIENGKQSTDYRKHQPLSGRNLHIRIQGYLIYDPDKEEGEGRAQQKGERDGSLFILQSALHQSDYHIYQQNGKQLGGKDNRDFPGVDIRYDICPSIAGTDYDILTENDQ